MITNQEVNKCVSDSDGGVMQEIKIPTYNAQISYTADSPTDCGEEVDLVLEVACTSSHSCDGVDCADNLSCNINVDGDFQFYIPKTVAAGEYTADFSVTAYRNG